MKKNCICLNCANLMIEYLDDGIMKCLFQIDDDDTISDDLLNGEIDECPFEMYRKKSQETMMFDNYDDVVINPFYVGPAPKCIPSYRCNECSHCKNRSCDAFPEGIPYAIIGAYGHKEKILGQNNDIVFEWNEERVEDDTEYYFEGSYKGDDGGQ